MGAGLLAAVVLSGCSDGGGGPSDPGTPSPASPSASSTRPGSGSPSPASPRATPAVTDRPPTSTAPAPPPSAAAEPRRPAGPAALWGREYSGTAQVFVDVYDSCGPGGTRRPADRRSYSMPATLSLGRPRSGGGAGEDNPFTLVLGIGQPSESGALSLWSAAVSSVSNRDLAGNPRDPDLLLTYWDLDWRDGRLSGRLVDPHTEQAVALNLLNWPTRLVACRPELGQLPGGFPHAVARGAAFEGRLDTGGASLTGTGGTTDGVLEFRFVFSGSS